MARHGYAIKTPEYHLAQIARHAGDNARRLDYDVSDVGLSSWASGQLMSYHHAALEALALGEKHGFDGPAVEATFLVDADGDIVSTTVDTNYFNGNPKQEWRLTREQRTALGRYSIPAGKTSRIQKQLGLHEKTVVVPSKRFFDAEGTFVGGPIIFTLRPEGP